jgi:hypothetical protein
MHISLEIHLDPINRKGIKSPIKGRTLRVVNEAAFSCLQVTEVQVQYKKGRRPLLRIISSRTHTRLIRAKRGYDTRTFSH